MYDNNPSGWMWIMMAAFMVGFWVLVFLAVGALWSAGRRDRTPPAAMSPRELLDARLARGEISVAEHRERVEQLAERAR